MKPILWALFGNDDDGPYGIYPHTWWGAVRWWLRNPAHNLTHHALARPGGPFFKRVIQISSTKSFVFYIGWRPPDGHLGFKCTIETTSTL